MEEKYAFTKSVTTDHRNVFVNSICSATTSSIATENRVTVCSSLGHIHFPKSHICKFNYYEMEYNISASLVVVFILLLWLCIQLSLLEFPWGICGKMIKSDFAMCKARATANHCAISLTQYF